MTKYKFHLMKPLVTTNISSIIKTSSNYVSKVYYNKDMYSNEIDILKILDHKQIIKIHKTYIDEYNKGVIELKYYKDGDLLNYINKYVRKQDSEFTADKKQLMFTKLLSPFIYCHEQNVIHGDIKPENVVLDDTTPVLIDFGLSIYNSEFSNHKHNQVINHPTQGTDIYMAPEVKDNLIGPCSDIFSLGVLLYQLFTNERPYYNDTINLTESIIKENDIPIHIQTLLYDMLQQNYTIRPTIHDIYYYYNL